MSVRLRRHLLPPLVLVGTLLAAPAGTAGAIMMRPTSPTASAPLTARLVTSVDRAVAQARTAEIREARAARKAEARRLRRSKRPEAVVRRAWLLGMSDRETYGEQRAILRRARRLGRQLPGARGSNQRDAVAVADRLAARRILTTDRLRPVLLTLSRNSDWWVRRGAPAYGLSLVRGRGPVSMKYIPGQGLVLHQLSSWALVSSLAAGCMEDRAHCPRRRLRSAVDTMMGLAVRRDRVARAESYFRFGGAPAPWISSITQGTMIQALTRSAEVLGYAPDRRRARAALRAFSRPAPQGLSVRAPGGRHYVMYSTQPSLRVLNGHLHALAGLRDLATIGRSQAARRLYRRGEAAARVELRKADTGAWSRYSDGGAEAPVGYHQLVTTFLGDLCRRDAGKRYCQATKRFRRYLREPTRATVRTPRSPRAKAGTHVSVWISKVSTVTVTVRDVRGRVALRRVARLPRGRHTFGWSAPHKGRYRVRVTAAGPGSPPLGRATTQTTALRSLGAARLVAKRAKARTRKAKAAKKAKVKAKAKADAKAKAKKARARQVGE